jgi:hypothetical protein
MVKINKKDLEKFVYNDFNVILNEAVRNRSGVYKSIYPSSILEIMDLWVTTYSKNYYVVSGVQDPYELTVRPINANKPKFIALKKKIVNEIVEYILSHNEVLSARLEIRYNKYIYRHECFFDFLRDRKDILQEFSFEGFLIYSVIIFMIGMSIK